MAAFCLPAVSQVGFPGQITANTSAPVTLANPVYYNETITSVTASTAGTLSCSTYPQISFFYTILTQFVVNLLLEVTKAEVD
jgi:hypothetical protein